MNIIRLLTIVIATFFFHLCANAQLNISFQAGITYNTLKVNYPREIIYKPTMGYVFGSNLVYSVNQSINLEISPMLLQKSFFIENRFRIHQKIINSFIQLPFGIGGKFKIRKSLNLTATLGGYYAYWLNRKITGLVPNIFDISQNSDGMETVGIENIDTGYPLNRKTDNRNEFGWFAKIRLGYKISKSFRLNVEGSYYNSETNQQKQTYGFQVSKYNRTFLFTTGLIYFISY